MAEVKICGIKDQENLRVAIESGARFVGFVFYEPSPRFVNKDTAKALSAATPKSVRRVGLFVDPTDKALESVLADIQLDMIQLHDGESAERVSEIKKLTNLPVMKALRIETKYDFEGLEDFEEAADWLLFDAKPAGADLPGGTGQSFDWNLLKGKSFKKPWMLSGGLTAENVKDAIAALKPKAVDVSSGVETERGVKDPGKIREFIKAAKS